MVEFVQVVVNALVVGAVGAILGVMTHGLRRELWDLRAEVRADIAELRAEVRGDLGELRAEVREVRSDLTRVALVVGAERRAGEG